MMRHWSKRVSTIAALCLLAATACTVDTADDTQEDPSNQSLGAGVGTYEAENRTSQSGCLEASTHAGFNGTGYMDFGGNGTWIQWNNISAAQAGEYTLTFRYANGAASKRQAAVIVNGKTKGNVPFAATGSWTKWNTASIKVSLRPGNNTIQVKANTGYGGPNVDHMTVAGGSGGSGNFFTIAMYPDLQKLTANRDNEKWLYDTTNFIIARKQEHNIRATLSVGDIVQVPDLCAQQSRWNRMLNSTHNLRKAGIALIPACGNHDGCANNYGAPSDFNAQFTNNTSCSRTPYVIERDNPLFQDNYSQYQPGVGVENAYYLIEQGGKKFIVLSLRYDTDGGSLQKIWDNWAHGVLNAHKDAYAIILSHEIQDKHATNACQHDNVKLALQGHRHGGRQRSVIACGNGRVIPKFIYAFRHNETQYEPEAAAARFFKFDLARNRVDMTTYSVYERRWLTDTRACGDSPDDPGHCDTYSWAHSF